MHLYKINIFFFKNIKRQPTSTITYNKFLFLTGYVLKKLQWVFYQAANVMKIRTFYESIKTSHLKKFCKINPHSQDNIQTFNFMCILPAAILKLYGVIH